MSTPVYNPSPNVKNRPMARKDAQGNIIPSSFSDLAFRGDYSGVNLTYKGIARPGALDENPVWQICLLSYDLSNNLESITWPQDANANASNDYQFVWDDRVSYTYS